MPNVNVRILRKSELPPLDGQPIFAHYNGESLQVFVLEGGMASGQPSVAIVAPTKSGFIILETSLLALNAAAKAAVGMAETQLGWQMPP